MTRLHSITALALTLLTGCSSITQSVSWRTRTFVRVPAGLPKGYDDHTNSVVHCGDWNFKHVVACPTAGGQPVAHWWMAYPTDDKKLKLKDASVWKLLFTGTAVRMSDWRAIQAATPEIANACMNAFHAYPQMVQPDLIFKEFEAKAESKRIKDQHERIEAAGPKPVALKIGELPDGGWMKGATGAPPYDPVWQQGPQFSQIAAAKQQLRAEQGSAGGGIRIGILDVGYSHHHLLVPKNTLGRNGQPGGDEREGEAIGDAINALAYAPEGTNKDILPGETNGDHGMHTMSILAGPKVMVQKDDNVLPEVIMDGMELGGAPDAVIVPARVAPYVVSVATANLAYAIDYASRVQHCDVISMSHGGAPSAMWIDAVNAAYERGTAMFGATSDYYNLPLIELGIGAPSSPVYPAACRRVQSVAGVSANGVPYGQNDLKHYPLYYLNPRHWFTQRGGFGADGVHRDVLHTSLDSMNDQTDKSQSWFGGVFRPQPISAPSPNIAAAMPPTKDNNWATNVMDLSFAGTSAATPQAAAAAALWLQKYRAEIERSGDWRNWRKAEAVYIAMLRTAGGRMPGASATPLEIREVDKYCGAGSLKAADMLKVSFADAQHTYVKGKLQFPKLPDGIRRDYYDGQRSGAAILGLETHFPPYRQRADTLTDRNHVVTAGGDLASALDIIFYNQRLVQQWNIGRIPRKAEKPMAQEEAKHGKQMKEVEGGLKARKNWFVHFFSPDEGDLANDAQKMTAKALHK